ncbi:restriction endonuclease [Thermococcus sp. JdF3]|uniref:restriction endonuclease n=1 Tax=Thermococcus sp. JdF3 TaxID=1638258 RepID=UPI00143B22D9|nr:restriction endonuclease [Thermococcus sp. JdF3]NJE01309.1 restriction endonuclease [Thermococcus sp. JdF3]
MPWTADLIRLAPRETLVGDVIELLKRMGFRDYERVAGRKEWGIDVVAIRDDPIAGIEKVVLAVHPKGLASSRDVNVFADLVNKYRADKGILISPAGFTKDAKVLISREHRGRVVPWDGEKLASLFNNYRMEPPADLVEQLKAETEAGEEKGPLEEFELDAPLLHDFSPEAVLEKVASFAASRYPVKPEEVKLESIAVSLSSAYIFSWSVEGDGEKDRAVVFSEDRIVLRATQDKNLSVPVTRALLNDGSIIRATEREVEVPLSPSEAVFVLKAVAAKELGVPESRVTIHERKKVYVPKEARLEVRVGENLAGARVDLERGEVTFEMNPLPDEYFIERTRDIVRKQTGEEISEYELKRTNGKVKTSGKTGRFSFEVQFNGYTGRLLGMEVLMSDDALSELLRNAYPHGRVINLEKGKKAAIADILLDEGVVVVSVDLTDGSYEEARRLPSPEDAFENARTVIEGNFPLRGLVMESYRVLEHKYLELVLESADGRAVVKVDGSTGDVLDYLVEVTPDRAKEIVSEKYPDFKIKSVEGTETEYTVTAENDRHMVTVRVSRDGKLIEEADRVLRRDLAERMAAEAAKEIDEEAMVRSVTLNENWEVEFAGRTKVGRFVLHRTTGEVLKSDARFTEMAIKESYLAHVREKYKEERPAVERLVLYEERGYVHIKVAGRETLYYARIDTRTGKIISEDRAPTKGITAKLKQLQLDSRYK